MPGYAVHDTANERDYLCVDAWLASPVCARALAWAIGHGLIDKLDEARQVSDEDFVHLSGLEPTPAVFMQRLLLDAGVLERDGEFGNHLSNAFHHAWTYRDLLAVKLEMSLSIAADWFDRFDLLLEDFGAFVSRSRLFEIFNYARAQTISPENIAATERWLKYTTVLTRYESRAILSRHDFSDYRKILDVGGNSGEFALQTCRCYPEIEATVLDLPAVCALGEAHVGRHPEGPRIQFHHVDSTHHIWPSGFDLVNFKSMLHDWPDSMMTQFLRQAREALNPGGRVLIVERSDEGARNAMGTLNFGNLPLWMFYRSYRASQVYQSALMAVGFDSVEILRFDLDMAFHMITATKVS